MRPGDRPPLPGVRADPGRPVLGPGREGGALPRAAPSPPAGGARIPYSASSILTSRSLRFL
jgi:hypothetical protein